MRARLHPSDRWSRRRPTTSRTPWGMVMLQDFTSSGRSRRPSATRRRTISLTKNGLPSVSRYTASTSASGGPRPAVSSMKRATSRSLRPRRRMRWLSPSRASSPRVCESGCWRLSSTSR